MSISPVHMSGIIQRTDDVGTLKHQQDTQPALQQQNGQTQMVRREERLRHQVLDPEHSGKLENHADAKEEGKNSYFFNRNKKKKKEEETKLEDKVVKKNSGFGFDVKV